MIHHRPDRLVLAARPPFIFFKRPLSFNRPSAPLETEFELSEDRISPRDGAMASIAEIVAAHRRGAIAPTATWIATRVSRETGSMFFHAEAAMDAIE